MILKVYWSEGGGVASRERLTFRFASAQRPRASFPGPPPAGPARQRSLRACLRVCVSVRPPQKCKSALPETLINDSLTHTFPICDSTLLAEWKT